MIALCLIGQPCSGKSSLARALTLEGLPAVRVRGGARGAEAASKGELLDDESASISIFDQLIVHERDGHRAVTVDGFPRSVPQAERLLRWSMASERRSILAVLLSPTAAELERRRRERSSSESRPDDDATIRQRREARFREHTSPAFRLLRSQCPHLAFRDEATAEIRAAILHDPLFGSHRPLAPDGHTK